MVSLIVDKYKLIKRRIPATTTTSKVGYTSDFTGRLGNHMLIYAYVRSLAEMENKPFKLKSDLLLRTFNVQQESLTEAIIYERPKGTPWYQEKENLNILLKNRDRIKRWFTPHNSGRILLEQRNYPTVVHIRGTDFNQPGLSLPIWYYQKAMKKDDNYLIVTDDIDYCKRIIRGKYEVINTPDDLSILYYAKKIIINHSTFGWWGAFLGEHDSILTPPLKTLETLYYTNTKPIIWGIHNLGWTPIT